MLSVIILYFLVCIAVGSDVSNLPGPFFLVTTDSLTVPVVPTANLWLYYNNVFDNRTGNLNLFPVPVDEGAAGETFQLLYGVLGTFEHPSDMAGDQPYNATTPADHSPVSFNDISAPHAGFDFINSTFLAIHGLLADTWYLCPDSFGFDILTYKIGPGCRFTYVAAVTTPP